MAISRNIIERIFQYQKWPRFFVYLTRWTYGAAQLKFAASSVLPLPL